jgi:hypothetical protein
VCGKSNQTSYQRNGLGVSCLSGCFSKPQAVV